MLDFLFGNAKEKNEVLDWLVEHDNGDYHGFPMTYGYELNRVYYDATYSLDALKQMKEDMIAKHNRYLYEKSFTKNHTRSRRLAKHTRYSFVENM